MQERYAHIAADANFTTLVAEVRGRVVGLIGMQTSYSYEKNGRHCRIMALVVHEHYRGSGIGRLLLLAAEQWAAEQQVDSLSLNSGNRADREAAHAFYQRMGYTAGSTGFSKTTATATQLNAMRTARHDHRNFIAYISQDVIR